MKKSERSYQIEGRESVYAALHKGTKNLLMVLATGLGKTFVAIKTVSDPRLNAKRVLWLTHTEELIEQSSKAILVDLIGPEVIETIDNNEGLLSLLRRKRTMYDTETELSIKESIGVIKRDLFEIDRPFVVASIQTIYNRLDLIDSDHFDVIVIDEAHMAAANTWTKSIEHFDVKLRLGLTATPDRLDGLSLSDLFDTIVFERDIKFGIDNNFLCELDAYRIKTNVNIGNVKRQAGDFNQKELEALVDTDERNNLIVKEYIQRASGRQFIAFCVNINHAQRLADAFNEAGISTSFVVGEKEVCQDRKERIDDFMNGGYVGLTNVNILTAGFDYPEVSCIIMARPTQSKTLFMQAIGRGTRLKKGKFKDCLILDIVDNSGKHSLINTWTLDKGSRFEDKIFMSKEKVLAAIEERDSQRKMKEIESTKRINLLKLPDVVFYDTYNTREAATEEQLKLAKSFGFDVENNHFTKGQIIELIAKLPASPVELDFMTKHGYDVSMGATKGQYSKVKKKVDEEEALKKRNVHVPFAGLN